MRCPSLSELPPPPEGKHGWPWTEESVRVSATSGQAPPRLTIVTPSFKQGEFIEQTIRSVLLQGYPDIEYFVMDGGSTDGTVDIIRKYSRWITFWVSERDGGQSAAINRGLRLGTGSYAAWINSDDMLCKDALANVGSALDATATTLYCGDCINIDGNGDTLFVHRGRVHSFEDLVRIRSVWSRGGYICQPEVLFPLKLTLDVGALDERNHYTMDYELWGRLFLAGAGVRYTGFPFGMFRHHALQKTQHAVAQITSMMDAAEALVGKSDLPAPVRREVLDEIAQYRRDFPKEHWRSSGRLARLGLPPVVVTPMRQIRRAVARGFGLLVSSS